MQSLQSYRLSWKCAIMPAMTITASLSNLKISKRIV
jgi:hypothetical protein